MAKKFLTMVVMVLFVSVAMAESYLYWMSQGTSLFEKDWSYAKVRYRSSSESTEVNYLGGGATFDKSLRTEVEGVKDFRDMSVAIGSVTLGSSYQFALELFNESGKSIAMIEEWVPYDSRYIGEGGTPATMQADFHFWHIPEPSSGLLALLGFGMLALRRKSRAA